jgi:hypothetical protein
LIEFARAHRVSIVRMLERGSRRRYPKLKIPAFPSATLAPEETITRPYSDKKKSASPCPERLLASRDGAIAPAFLAT